MLRIVASIVASALILGSPSVSGNVHISVARSGCGRVVPHETLGMAIGRNDRYPGDGKVWPDLRPFPWHGAFSLQTGYYSAQVANEYCWEAFYPFAVLTGHERHLQFVLNARTRDPKMDYFIYTVPYGAVVGRLPRGESRPRLRGLDEQSNHLHHWWNDYYAEVEPDGWFYFDQVITGRYALETDVDGTTSGTIVKVTKDAVLRTGDAGDYQGL